MRVVFEIPWPKLISVLILLRSRFLPGFAVEPAGAPVGREGDRGSAGPRRRPGRGGLRGHHGAGW